MSLKRERKDFFLIVGSAIVLVGLWAAMGQGLAHRFLAPDLQTTAAIDIGVTEASVPATEIVVGPTYHPTPYILAYALPFDMAGTGPLSVEAGDFTLLHLQPADGLGEFEFVKSLTLHLSISGDTITGNPTLDFELWNPFNGGWGINQGENKFNWGNNEIEIKYPDRYVSREGSIYMSLRNWGNQAIEIQDVSFTLVVQEADGADTIYNPAP